MPIAPLARAAALLLPALLMAGCAAGGAFPSLAPRAMERELAGEPQPRATATAPADPGSTARAAELLAAARRGDREFQARAAAAATAASRAGAAGSDSWVEAQQAISRAQAARTATVNALADLDRMLIALMAGNPPPHPADADALRSALAEVQAIAERQQSRLDQLRGSTGG